MNLNEFAKEVHANAISHGWWGEEYTAAVAIALIHAEISEALEEWRANRPMVYYKCRLDTVCNGNCKHDAASCVYKNPKPEGIAVELVDVALRILDTAAAWEFDVPPIDAYDLHYVFANYQILPAEDVDLPSLVAELHCDVANAWEELSNGKRETGMSWLLMTAMPNIYAWLRAQGVDPEPLMLEKHRYNQTRPYKHGGKRI